MGFVWPIQQAHVHYYGPTWYIDNAYFVATIKKNKCESQDFVPQWDILSTVKSLI